MINKNAAFLTIHGMGVTRSNYNEPLADYLRKTLGGQISRIHLGKIYYQDILQKNEEEIWKKTMGQVRWHGLRKFILYGFGDAAGLESRKEDEKSPYYRAQLAVARELLKARKAMGKNGPLMILAHSLGCQVISCFFWDAGQYKKGKPVRAGIWSDLKKASLEITKGIKKEKTLSDEEVEFLAGGTLVSLITTGCNIPIFVSAHSGRDIVPICPNKNFKWENYFDRDDVLGWPLGGLSPLYGSVVTDIQVNAWSGILSFILKSWNPFSHEEYWKSRKIKNKLAESLKNFSG